MAYCLKGSKLEAIGSSETLQDVLPKDRIARCCVQQGMHANHELCVKLKLTGRLDSAGS